MKILMINHFPLAGSGSGTYTRNLAVHLAALGHEVTIVLPENTEDYERIDGVRLHPVFFSAANDSGVPKGISSGSDQNQDGLLSGSDADSSGESMKAPLPFNFPCFTTHPRSTVSFGDLTDDELEMYKAAFTRAIDEEIERDRPDIIHGQHVWILPSLAVGKGIPIVLTAHGTDLMGYDKWPELRKYADRVMAECKYVISISKDNCDLIRERFPDSADKIVMMRNGYDPTIFFPEDDSRDEILAGYGISPEEHRGKKLICFAGKLAHFKGVDILLKAVGIIESKKSQIFVIIVGDGEERDSLRKQAEELGLRSVRFLGNVNMQALRKLYNIADVSIVPSRREPFGLVALEAMACGIPVVASNQGGLPDFVNDSVGALAKPEDPEDLANKILMVLGREDETAGAENTVGINDTLTEWRDRIAKYARAHFAQDTIIRELEDVYANALDDTSGNAQNE